MGLKTTHPPWYLTPLNL
uniref:Uncharacterized protein n=1 Tax=Arundo donax TaxID=35708 RepID=A0A0A9ASL7_ARUDO